MLIGLILALFKLPFAIELSWAVMLVYLFGYLLYINKLEAKKVRKRNFLLLMGTIVFTFGIIGGAFYVGQPPNVLTISNNELHISGTYGVVWQIDEITNIVLVEELPEIKMRTNGYSFGGRLKGRFRLEELGNGRLFIYRDNPPFIYIEKGEDYLFINSKQQEETLLWYEAAKEALS